MTPPRRYDRRTDASPSFPLTVFSAEWRQALDFAGLLAFRLGKKTLFLALTERSMGSMAEIRYALTVATSKTFAHDDALTSATLMPPGPFEGKGTYRAGPDGTRSWTGSLSVSFPGAPHFPLAGSQFKPALAAGL